MEQLRYVARAAGADSSLLVEEAAQALSMFARDPQALLVACKQMLSRQSTVGGLWWLCSRMLTAADPLDEARAVVSDLRTDRTAATLLEAMGELTPSAPSGHLGMSASQTYKLDMGPGGPRVLIAGWPDVVVATLAESSASVLVMEVDGVGHGVIRRLERLDIEAEVVAAERLAGAAAASDAVLVEAAAVGPDVALVDVGGVAMAAVARALDKPVWLISPASRVVPVAIWSDVVAEVKEWKGPSWIAPSELLPLTLVDVVVSGDQIHRLGSGSAATVIRSGWEAAPELIGLVRSDVG